MDVNEVELLVVEEVELEYDSELLELVVELLVVDELVVLDDDVQDVELEVDVEYDSLLLEVVVEDEVVDEEVDVQDVDELVVELVDEE